LGQEPLFGKDKSVNNMGKYDYQGITDSIIVEIQQKYNFRLRDKNSMTDPRKKIFSRSKKNETSQPSIEKLATKKKQLKCKLTKQK
jgi:hypothetical protein